MLAYDFDYYLPDTWREAVDMFDSLQKEGRKPLYYAGGTEIISMARVLSIQPGSIIDIKKIPECCVMGAAGPQFIFGSALTLNAIRVSGIYPLLALAGARVADHTIQCKLTLGGNLAGTIRYHETLLPLLLADAAIYTASTQGIRSYPIADAFAGGRKLPLGELIIKTAVDKEFAAMPYAHIKKSKAEKIGYPLVSLAALNCGGTMRLAVSGLCEYPFRFPDMPVDQSQLPADMAGQLAQSIPGPILDDIEGSAGYRLFILKRTIENIILGFRKGQMNG